MFPPHLHIARYDHKVIVSIHCSQRTQLILHHHRILQGSRSDNRPQDSYKLHSVHKHLDTCTRRCQHIHRMDFLRILRDIDTCSSLVNYDNRRWCRMHPAWCTHRCQYNVPLRHLRNLPYTYRRSGRADCNILRSQRILLLSMDLDTHRYLHSEDHRRRSQESMSMWSFLACLCNVQRHRMVCIYIHSRRERGSYILRSHHYNDIDGQDTHHSYTSYLLH